MLQSWADHRPPASIIERNRHGMVVIPKFEFPAVVQALSAHIGTTSLAGLHDGG